MKKIYLFALCAAFTFAAKAQYASLNDAEINKLKQLINTNADVKALYSEQEKIADASLNINPNPIDTIASEGKLKGDPKKTATSFALKDMPQIYASALVYKVTGGKEYLKNALEYLLAWAKVNHSKGDPIDDTNLDDAIAAYDLIKGNINPQNNQKIVTWFKQVADAEIASYKPTKKTGYNNWHSHRLKEVGEIGFAINDAGYQKFAVEGLKKQIEVNLLPDGSGVDFKLRDALHYHAYNLEPLLTLAIIVKRATGVDYYSYVSGKQTSIKKSTEWFLPYVSGEKTHAEFVNSTVKFDRDRAKNGEADYVPGTLFNPKNGIKALSLASYFDQQYLATIKKVKGSNTNYCNWQLVLNAAMSN